MMAEYRMETSSPWSCQSLPSGPRRNQLLWWPCIRWRCMLRGQTLLTIELEIRDSELADDHIKETCSILHQIHSLKSSRASRP